MKLIPDWKEAYKWFSIHGAVALTVLSTVYAYFGAFQAVLPASWFGWITAGLGTIIIIGRLIQQGAAQ